MAFAPVITPVPDLVPPVPAGTAVANLTQPVGDPDPGPYNYVLVNGNNELTLSGNGSDLEAAVELLADVQCSVTAEGTDGMGPSPETSATIPIGTEVEPPPGGGATDDYPGNPQLPPQGGDAANAWTMFIVQATHAVVKDARNGIDFVVARPDKYSAPANVYWNDALLGPRPDAEIEAEARRLAAEWPENVNPLS